MPQLFTNFAATTLDGPITAVATTIVVVDGSAFPTPTGQDFFQLVLATTITEATREIVKVTARAGDTLTVVRGQEGTTPSNFASGDKAELRETSLLLNSLAGMFVYVHAVGHGFTTGKAVYFNGTSWALAKSDADTTIGIGIVSVIDADNFRVYTLGLVSGLTGLTAGAYFFVSDAVAGSLTATEPTAGTSYSNPILFAISTTSGIVIPYRPSQVLTSVSYVPLIDFLLDNEPVAQNATYTITYNGTVVTKEEWFYSGPSLLKSIDYTYISNLMTTEVRKVFDTDGVTVVAQSTINYSYSGATVTNATYVRNI